MTLTVRPAMVNDDGTFTFGTPVDKAFIDAAYDQIDDQCHSSTNPTLKPKSITDEVVAARGSKSTLTGRLDVVLNPDGTLKTQASLVTLGQVQSALGGRNVAVNGDLDDWSAGGSAAPDNFTLTGAGATIARTGLAMGDTFQFGTGANGFAAKVTRAGNDWKLQQDVIAGASFTNFANCKGQKFSVSVKGKTAIASYLRIVVDDGVTTDASTYHTGGGAEEHLSVTHIISNSATKLSVYVEGTGSNGDGYVGGFNFVFADIAPSDWSPLSSTPDANATRRGVVNTGAQTLAGVKTFVNGPVWQALPTGLGAIVFSRVSGSDVIKNNSVTLSDVAGMTIAINANETWAFEFHIFGISTTVADWKFAVTGPSALTAIRYGMYSPIDNTGSAHSASSSGGAIAGDASGVEEYIIVSGLIRNGANAGNIQLQFAQNTLEATNSTVRIDSHVKAHRVA